MDRLSARRTCCRRDHFLLLCGWPSFAEWKERPYSAIPRCLHPALIDHSQAYELHVLSYKTEHVLLAIRCTNPPNVSVFF